MNERIITFMLFWGTLTGGIALAVERPHAILSYTDDLEYTCLKKTDFDDPKVIEKILREAVLLGSLRRVKSEGKWLHYHGLNAQPYTGWARQNHGTLHGGQGNGKLMGLFYFKDGISEPLSAGWHENGQKSSKRMGSRHVTWYANGQMNVAGHWKNQEKEGLWTTWDSDGNVLSKIFYKDGKEVKEEQGFSKQK